MNPERLRIVHVSATFPPYFGGTGTVCYHNARVLAARGHDVHVYTSEWPGQADDPTGVTVHRLKPILRVGNAPVLPQLLRLPGDAIVHLHYPFYAGAEFVALARRPYVVTYHQDVELEGWLGRATHLHDRIVGRRVLRHASRLCPTSLDYFQSSTFADLIPTIGDRVVPIPNGVDPVTFHPGPRNESIVRRYRLPSSIPIVLFVGSMDRAHYFKGIPTLLQALTRVPDVGALLVGDGDLRDEYEQMTTELGLTDRVRFTGRVDAQELPQIYRVGDVLVLPSETRGEAFGVVLLEAMATGRPVIATDLPGVRSVVTSGVDGFLVEPKDPEALAATIARVAALDPASRKAMGAAGRHKVEAEYDWERVADRLESLYRSVVADLSASAPKASLHSERSQTYDLPIEMRVALDLIVQSSGGTDGLIRGRVVGAAPLVEELSRYAPNDPMPSILLALAAPADQVTTEVMSTRPNEVVTLVKGPLYRVLRPLRSSASTTISMPSGLSTNDWKTLGYEIRQTIGVQGIGSLGWALGGRITARAKRPDLADRCRIGMLRTLVASGPLSLSALRVLRYQRVAR